MAHRIEIFTKVNDSKSQVMAKKLQSCGFNISSATVVEVYVINKDFKKSELKEIAEMLSNPVSQKYGIDEAQKEISFNFALEIGFLPGVTDNIATTARETIEDFFKLKFSAEESVHSSMLIFIKGELSEKDVEKIGDNLANSLIQRITIKSHEKFAADNGMDTTVPLVHLSSKPEVDKVDLSISEEELLKLGKEGIPNKDGTRRGPLALEKDSLEVIKKYFAKEDRPPTDIELESLAQTWSEHCKHTIFAAKIDDNERTARVRSDGERSGLAGREQERALQNEQGLYKGYIKKATNDIRKAKARTRSEREGESEDLALPGRAKPEPTKGDFCMSVFSDNAGGIIFDENWIITDKAETHNSPSALDPFGGAITGIIGVNRDCLGFGKGAKPIINKYGFCVGNPFDKEPIYRDAKLTNAALPPHRILEGVIEGVNAGGNCSGIPTPQGFVYFHDGYKGKPLIFVGTIGLIPRKINGKNSWEKKAEKGDKIVVIGGRVGMDGIHGATFSSEALSSGSPATAVQIGDPITQKKFSDAIVKEARDRELYHSITDNGAGGISCSVPEMAKECGGCLVNLEKVPTKYPNLSPWQIWISESQERMTLAVPSEKLTEFEELMAKRDVESTVIGEFTDDGRCVVKFNDEKIMDLAMDFLHEGLPRKSLKTTYTRIEDLPNHKRNPEPDFPEPADLTQTLLNVLARPNICSYEFISTQYDHNVQGGTIIKPLQGRGRVNGVASVTKPFPESTRGVICSQGLNPIYSEIDTYHMAACAIDTAVRNVIAIGGTLDHLALMDNFCWCSSNEPERLGQLKAACEAVYDYAVAYGTPYISGKDSMFNDFKGFDAQGKAVKISVSPTLLISSLGVLDDLTLAVSLDPKFPGDLIYILGETKDELGGSEYFQYQKDLAKSVPENAPKVITKVIPGETFIGNSVPKVDAKSAIKLYRTFRSAVEKRLISSALSPQFGGLGITLAKKAIAGRMGMEIDISKVPGFNSNSRDAPNLLNSNFSTKNKFPPTRLDHLLFSESQSRFVVTIDPKRQAEFEKHFANVPFALLGKTTNNQNFVIKTNNGDNPSKIILKTNIATLDQYYRKTFNRFSE
ncbi:phosphoribosylformylglycinamidine synthase [Candidatus Peregrinibacteria bacterium]|nr:phosphoribosylformylglycinamidine synthase [Candidatus Peregrinibacteria bacterium]